MLRQRRRRNPNPQKLRGLPPKSGYCRRELRYQALCASGNHAQLLLRRQYPLKKWDQQQAGKQAGYVHGYLRFLLVAVQ